MLISAAASDMRPYNLLIVLMLSLSAVASSGDTAI